MKLVEQIQEYCQENTRGLERCVTQAEMTDLLKQEEASNKELKSLFEKLGYIL